MITLIYTGFYDPPYALHGVASAAAPTASSINFGSAVTSPAPAVAPNTGQPVETGNPSHSSIPADPDPKSSSGDPAIGDPSSGGSIYSVVSPGDHSSASPPPILPTLSIIPNKPQGSVAASNILSALKPSPSKEASDPGSNADGGDTASLTLDPILGDNFPTANSGSHDQPNSAASENQGPSTGEAGAASKPGANEVDPGSSSGSNSDENASSSSDPQPSPGNDQSSSMSPKISTGSGNNAIIGGENIQQDPSHPDGIVVGSHSIAQGQVTQLDGTPISVGPNKIVIGSSSTILIPTAGSQDASITPMATLGGAVIQTDPSHPGAILIGATRTLQPGQTAAIDGTSVSLNSAGLVVHGSTTIPFPPAAPGSDPSFLPVVNVGSQVYTLQAQSGAVVIGSNTLSAGGVALTTAGKTFSAIPSGLVVVSAGSSSTYAFPTANGVVATSSAVAAASGAAAATTTTGNVEVEAAFTISDQAFTAFEVVGQSGKAVVVGSDGKLITLSIGGSATTVDGQTISLGADGIVIETGTDMTKAPWSTVTNADVPSQASVDANSPGLGPWSTASMSANAGSSAVSASAGSQGTDASTSASASVAQATNESGVGKSLHAREGIASVVLLWMMRRAILYIIAA